MREQASTTTFSGSAIYSINVVNCSMKSKCFGGAFSGFFQEGKSERFMISMDGKNLRF